MKKILFIIAALTLSVGMWAETQVQLGKNSARMVPISRSWNPNGLPWSSDSWGGIIH